VNQETLHYTEVVAHLQRADPVLEHIIERCGPCTLQPRSLEPLVMLCRSIIYQQLSGKAPGGLVYSFIGHRFRYSNAEEVSRCIHKTYP
jgi:3-methyladenine DNA glycosylase/8-oxoguanine DNA glycosylase